MWELSSFAKNRLKEICNKWTGYVDNQPDWKKPKLEEIKVSVCTRCGIPVIDMRTDTTYCSTCRQDYALKRENSRHYKKRNGKSLEEAIQDGSFIGFNKAQNLVEDYGKGIL